MRHSRVRHIKAIIGMLSDAALAAMSCTGRWQWRGVLVLWEDKLSVSVSGRASRGRHSHGHWSCLCCAEPAGQDHRRQPSVEKRGRRGAGRPFRPLLLLRPSKNPAAYDAAVLEMKTGTSPLWALQ